MISQIYYKKTCCKKSAHSTFGSIFSVVRAANLRMTEVSADTENDQSANQHNYDIRS